MYTVYKITGTEKIIPNRYIPGKIASDADIGEKRLWSIFFLQYSFSYGVVCVCVYYCYSKINIQSKRWLTELFMCGGHFAANPHQANGTKYNYTANARQSLGRRRSGVVCVCV